MGFAVSLLDGALSRGKRLMSTLEERRALRVLEHRIRTILPEEYQDSYQDVEPVSMGSAGLTFGRDGWVAWNDVWGVSAIWPWQGALLTKANCSCRRPAKRLKRSRRAMPR